MILMVLSLVGDKFNRPTDKAVHSLPGIKKLVDDMPVLGPDDEVLQKRLEGLLDRTRKHKIKVSIKKFAISKKIELGEFMVKMKEDKEWVCPDLEKVSALQSMSKPKDKKGVHEFLGLAKQLEAWTPKLSLVTRLMRGMVNKHSQFQ